MDHISGLHIEGDTTFALMLEAQARGHELFHYTPGEISYSSGRVVARGHSVEVRDVPGDYYQLDDERLVDLGEFDVVHLRQDPPFDMNYITTTHLLEMIHPKTLVVNNPFEVRNAPEKLYLLKYPELTAPTLITRSEDEVASFRAAHKDIIVKPLYGNGGAGVFRIRSDDTNLSSLLELMKSNGPEPFIVQAYLSAVRQGDKRIILVDGVAVGAINRVPAENETRSNMHVGGRPEHIELTERDKEICAAIGPELKERGLILVGIDVIGGVLTEINVTSPTGVREVAKFGGADIAALVWEAIEGRVG
ncbi:MAG: glutathione synthetase [Rhodomicrobium sp.]|nr:MAG: glutathione synthetase [Rhodomicrobium sp.]